MIRILKKNGRALIYVWAKNQEAGGEKSSYLKQNYKKNLKKDEKEECKLQVVSLSNSNEEIILPIHNNRTAFNHNDLLVPWKLKTKSDDSNDSNEAPVYLRFYHVYEENELKNLCLKMENVDVLDYYYDQGNWCIILQKK